MFLSGTSMNSMSASAETPPSDVTHATSTTATAAPVDNTTNHRPSQISRTKISALPRRRPASITSIAFQTKSEEDQVKQEPGSPIDYGSRYIHHRHKSRSIPRKKGIARKLKIRPYSDTSATQKRSNEGRIRWNDALRLGLKLIMQEFASDRSGVGIAQLFSDTFATELRDMGVALPVAHGRLNWQYSEYLKGTGVQASWERVDAAGLTAVVALRRRIRTVATASMPEY